MSIRTRVALLALCAGLTFWNGLPAPFILDDRTAILTNKTIQTLTLPGPFDTPSETPVARRPLVNLSFAISYALAGYNPYWYRAGNLLIHVLAALALFGVVRRTLLLLPQPGAHDAKSGSGTRSSAHAHDPPRRPRIREDLAARATPIAWICALIWLVHPLNSEVVDYVTQRSAGMLGLFCLLTIYCAIRAATERRAGRWTAAAIACCIAGLLCKESMATVPVLVVLFDRVFLYQSWREQLARRAALYGGLACSWILLAVVIASADRTSAGFGATLQSGDVVSSWTYLLNQARLIPRYLYLTVWPHALVADYGITTAVPLASVVIPGLLLVAAVVCVLVGLRRWPHATFPAAWFFITLAPSSSFVPIATEVGAERRMYLPLAGIVVLSVVGIYVLARHRQIGVRPLRACAAVVIVALAVGTIVRNRDYLNPVRLAETVVERWPSGRAHVHLGTLYNEAGRKTEAISQFRKAASLYPPGDYALGVTLVENQQVDEGMAHLRAFVTRAPRHSAVAGARDLIGRVLIDRNDLEGAGRQFELLIADNPFNARAVALLAEVRLRQQRLEDAVALFERAHRMDPAFGRDAAVMRRYGVALATMNRLHDAERVFAEAAAANPADPGLQKLWGRSLAAIGRFAAAAERFRQAQHLAPGDPETRQLMAAISQRLGTVRRSTGP